MIIDRLGRWKVFWRTAWMSSSCFETVRTKDESWGGHVGSSVGRDGVDVVNVYSSE